jgi:hypothetical protein
MGKYTEQLETMNFSNSSINTFETCGWQFYLTYIEKVPKVGNFFSDYGSFIHLVIEKYLKGKLEIWEMLDYYQKEFSNNIKNSPPAFMRNAWNDYYDAGYEFFKNFNFDRDEYELIQLEDFVKGTDRGINVTIKPDIVIKNKTTNELTLLDFKTSEIINKKGVLDQKKLDGYKSQLNLYVYFLWQFKGLEITKARLWFIRSNTFFDWDYEQYLAQDSLDKFIETAKKIQQAEEWPYNNSSSFMCSVLCSVRNSCQYRAK